MNKKVLGLVAAAAVVIIGGAFAFNGLNSKDADSYKEGAVKVEHTLGTTVIESEPERVVVLDLGALDVLNEMEVNIVGVPSGLPEYLSKYESDEYTNVGSLKEPDLEAINELNPDLIVMAGRMSDYYDDFSEIAPTLYVESEGSNYIESFNDKVTTFGEIFNKEELVNEMKENVANKVKEIKSNDATALCLMVNGRAISAFGADSRYGLLFNEAGFIQIDENIEESTHGQEVTSEYVLEQNPDYIFVVDRNSITGSTEITAESIIENELIKETNAYKNGKIIYLNSVNWYTVSGGYQSTLSMIDEILNAISK